MLFKMRLNIVISLIYCAVLSEIQANGIWKRVHGYLNYGTYESLNLVLSTQTTVSVKRVVRIECHNSRTKQNNRITSVDDSDVLTKLDLTQKVGFIIHGWNMTFDSPYILDIYSAWAENRQENICRVDWSPLSNVDYAKATENNYIDAARYIALFIRGLNDNFNLKYENVILVGFSIGAQVAGVIGHNLGNRVGLIIGLDPAGQNYNYPFRRENQYRLDENDAIIVQAIHTSYLIRGSASNVGQQDIFVNTGLAPQPGCLFPNFVDSVYRETIVCSHFRALQIFEDSLRNGKNCVAIQCDNLLQYFTRGCYQTYDYIGLDTKGYPGVYYLITKTNPTCIGKVYHD